MRSYHAFVFLFNRQQALKTVFLGTLLSLAPEPDRTSLPLGTSEPTEVDSPNRAKLGVRRESL